MKANELRIGNKVGIIKSDRVYTVIGIEKHNDSHLINLSDNDNNEYHFTMDMIRPLDILSSDEYNLGFVMDEISPTAISRLNVGDIKFVIGSDFKGGHDWCIEKECKVMLYHDNFKFKYLHQLQNIYFMLFGEELIK